MPTTPPYHNAFAMLVCPLCGAALGHSPPSLRCEAGHTFDIARHGYAGLLGAAGTAARADTAAMVEARSAFLSAGHYAPVARAAAAHVNRLAPPGGRVLDAGAGTGYHLSAALDACDGALGLGLDLSKYAARRAARAHPRAGAATWDVRRRLPLRDRSIDVLLNVFSPRNGAEFQRVLRPGGALVVVTPGGHHLAELVRDLGLLSVDTAKEDRLRRALAGRFRLEHAESLDETMSLTAGDVRNLALMGPAAWHRDPAEVDAALARRRHPIPVTASFRLSVYRPVRR